MIRPIPTLGTALLVLTLTSDAVQQLSTAVLREPCVIPQKAAGVQRVSPGEVYPCPRVTSRGYFVLVPASGGTPNFGFLPFRDEWGHLVADDWTFDSRLAPKTLRIARPATVHLRGLELPAGTPLHVLEKAKRVHTLEYVFGDHRWSLKLKPDAVILREAVPEQDPLKQREAELDRMLAERLSEQQQLQESLANARATNVRLAESLRQLARLAVERKTLSAEIESAKTLRARLLAMEWSTATNEQLENQRIEEATEKRAERTADAFQAGTEAGVLRLLHQRLLLVESQLRAADTEQIKGTAELDAMLRHAKDSEVANETAAAEATLNTAHEHLSADLTAQHQKEALRDVIQLYHDRIETVQQDDAAARADLAALLQQIQELKESITLLEQLFETPTDAAAKPEALRPEDLKADPFE